jgi:hypothetical protein
LRRSTCSDCRFVRNQDSSVEAVIEPLFWLAVSACLKPRLQFWLAGGLGEGYGSLYVLLVFPLNADKHCAVIFCKQIGSPNFLWVSVWPLPINHGNLRSAQEFFVYFVVRLRFTVVHKKHWTLRCRLFY